MQTQEVFRKQKEFFYSGATLSYEFRMKQLDILYRAIQDFEKEIIEALMADFRKPPLETYMTEIGITLHEIHFAKKHLKSWMKDKKVKTPITLYPAQSFIKTEPYGVTLIIAPWNYPFGLLFVPLIGAIAAGNCAVLKTAPATPHTAAVMKKLIESVFDNSYIAVFEGGREVNHALLEEKFDFIFFTGGPALGKIVMEAAAKNLTPLALELGGKSPCIVDKHADLNLTAERLTWGKFVNAGQTCVAPDYLLVHEDVKDKLLELMKKQLVKSYGNDPQKSSSYSRIVSDAQFKRIKELMEGCKIAYGGGTDGKDRYIAPTFLDSPEPDSPVMQEEIFGPVLPIFTFKNMSEAVDMIRKRPKPLALYLFTLDKNIENRILKEISFGGGCINDTVIHTGSPYLPFGGVGMSGFGSYHGYQSFKTFSHDKSILKKARFFDMPLRYPPYKASSMGIFKMFLK